MKTISNISKLSALFLGAAMLLGPAAYAEDKNKGRDFKDGKPPVEVKKKVRVAKTEKVTFFGAYSTQVDATLSHQLGFPEGFYLVLQKVVPGSPAEKAGLQKHDILQKVGDQKLINAEQLSGLIRSHKPGDKVEVTYFRGGKQQSVAVELGEQEVPVVRNLPGRPSARVLPQAGGGNSPIQNFPGWNFQNRSKPNPKGKLPDEVLEQLKALDPDQLQSGGNAHSFNFTLPFGGGGNLPDKMLEQLKKQGIDINGIQGKGNAHVFQFGIPFSGSGNLSEDILEHLKGLGVDLEKLGVDPGNLGGDDLDADVSSSTTVISTSNMHFTLSNDHGSLTLNVKDGKGQLLIRNMDGETLYNGPYEKGQEIRDLPGHWQERLRELDKQLDNRGPEVINPKKKAPRDKKKKTEKEA